MRASIKIKILLNISIPLFFIAERTAPVKHRLFLVYRKITASAYLLYKLIGNRLLHMKKLSAIGALKVKMSVAMSARNKLIRCLALIWDYEFSHLSLYAKTVYQTVYRAPRGKLHSLPCFEPQIFLYLIYRKAFISVT
jgi:hypothetical protein